MLLDIDNHLSSHKNIVSGKSNYKSKSEVPTYRIKQFIKQASPNKYIYKLQLNAAGQSQVSDFNYFSTREAHTTVLLKIITIKTA